MVCRAASGTMAVRVASTAGIVSMTVFSSAMPEPSSIGQKILCAPAVLVDLTTAQKVTLCRAFVNGHPHGIVDHQRARTERCQRWIEATEIKVRSFLARGRVRKAIEACHNAVGETQAVEPEQTECEEPGNGFL